MKIIYIKNILLLHLNAVFILTFLMHTYFILVKFIGANVE
jgi:hypothetical protein